MEAQVHRICPLCKKDHYEKDVVYVDKLQMDAFHYICCISLQK